MSGLFNLVASQREVVDKLAIRVQMGRSEGDPTANSMWRKSREGIGSRPIGLRPDITPGIVLF